MSSRLLVAIDDSDSASVTLDYAAAVARRESASVHVLFVNQFLVGGRGYTVLTADEAAKVVKRGLDQMRELGVEVTGSVVRATCFDVPLAIADVAQRSGSLMIIVGSRRRRHIGRLFGRGVREKVIRESHLPVVTAPAPLGVGAGGGSSPERELAHLVSSY